MDERLRAMFDEFAGQYAGDVTSPLPPTWAAAFDAWLLEPAPGGPRDVSRALARVYEARVDLRRAFPDPGGQDRDALLAWAASSGVAEEPVLARLLRAGLAPDGGDGIAEERNDRLGELSPALARLPARLAEGPQAGAPAGPGGPRGRLRQAVLRVIKPFTTYQQDVNGELVAALGDLGQDLLRKRAETARALSELTAAVQDLWLASTRATAVADRIAEIKALLTPTSDRNLYLALSELAQRHTRIGREPGPPPSDRSLTGCELRVFSQNGEDGLLAEILRRIGAPARHFVEFGIESGREGNCIYLADVAGWAGLFIEAEEEMYGRLADKYGAQPAIRTVRAEVTTTNIERLFAEAEVPPEPDVISIDVDGQDYWLWQAIESYRPRVMVIEYNSSLDPRTRLVQPDEPGHQWSGTEYYGASLGALESLAAEKGYRLIHTDLCGVNAFFVRSDLDGDALPPTEEVARRGTPNYFQRGVRHPPHAAGGRYLDLDTGKLIRSDRAAPR
jgi:hypothetical protein